MANRKVKLFRMTKTNSLVTDGSRCSNCLRSIYFGIVFFRDEMFCRPECALQKFGLKGKPTFRPDAPEFGEQEGAESDEPVLGGVPMFDGGGRGASGPSGR